MSFNLHKFILLSIAIIIANQLDAQRYLTPQFTTINVTKNVVYGNNISVLTGSPVPTDLLMDVYTPAEDTMMDRPVVVYFHTGNFLPPLFNGNVTGLKSDSSVTEICTRLAQMGYVAIAATYRQGWPPSIWDQDLRTGFLLQAIYRGIQDARTCVRFLRKEYVENKNPLGIDPDKIVLWGQGTGGFISTGAAFLDRFEEIAIPKFLDSQTLRPYIDTTIMGDVYGLDSAFINQPNHLGYSSDFALAVNMGGALCDSSWVDGGGNEPPIIGFHTVKDFFIPFAHGSIISLPTGDFYMQVSGTRRIIESANTSGLNDVFDEANTLMDAMNLNAINTIYKTIFVSLPGDLVTLSTDNMFPFRTEVPEARPWEWWGYADLQAAVEQTNMQWGTNFITDTIHNNNLAIHPDMSAAKGKAYIDTIMAYYLPRACEALGLESCCEALGINCTTSTNEVTAEPIGLTIMPNPASTYINFRSERKAIKSIQLFDFAGRTLRTYNSINSIQFEMPKGNLPSGIYIAQVKFGDQVINYKVVFE